MTPSMNFLVIKYSIPHTALTQAAISSDHAMSQLPQLLKCCTHTAAASFTCHCPALPQPCAGFLLFHFAGTFASHGTFILIHPNDGIKLIWGKKKKKPTMYERSVNAFASPHSWRAKRLDLPFSTITFLVISDCRHVTLRYSYFCISSVCRNRHLLLLHFSQCKKNGKSLI